MKKNFIISLPLLLAFISCPTSGPTSNEQTPNVMPAAQSGAFLDVSYGAHPGNKMDVYLCKNIELNTPTLIFIHGGGFTSGDKSDFQFPSGATDSGLNIVRMNYRFAQTGSVTYKEMLDDIAAVIAFLRNKKTEYNCNFEKISLYGVSAGGALALLYSYKRGGIHSAISLAGVVDFTDSNFVAMCGEDAVKDLLNKLLPENSETYKADASPITHARNPDNPYRNTTTLLFHGRNDTVVPYTQAEELFAVIESLNVKNKKFIYKNCGHGFGAEFTEEIVRETLNAVK